MILLYDNEYVNKIYFYLKLFLQNVQLVKFNFYIVSYAMINIEYFI